jgi:hypothetical protein
MSAYRSLTIDVPLLNLRYCGLPLQRSGTLESFGNAVPIDVHEEWVSKRMEQLGAEPQIHHLMMVLTLSGYIVETILVYQDNSNQSSTDVYTFYLNPASMHYSAERIQSATEIPTRWWELTETDLNSLPGAKSVVGFNLTNRYGTLSGQQYSYAVALPQFNRPGISVVDNRLFCWSTASSFEFDQLFSAIRTLMVYVFKGLGTDHGEN